MTATATIDPEWYDAALFDLDGVVTDTASVHRRAWKLLFDDVLESRPYSASENHEPFTDDDYVKYVDGKARLDGVTDFLASRGITLPRGDEADPADAATVVALGNRKNEYYLAALDDQQPVVFPSTVALIRSLQAAGVRTAVFSASRNCERVLDSAGLGDLFPERVDGTVAAELGLAGKPDPATLLEAARRLGAQPDRTLVVEDAAAGVEAARRGAFCLIVGIDRSGIGQDLRTSGADIVVADLQEVAIGPRPRPPLSQVPDARASLDDYRGMIGSGRLAVFLDFDGTLSPIVEQPEAAAPATGATEALRRLAALCPVAIISGRDLPDVRRRVGVDGIWYAGSHGFQLAGPAGQTHEYEGASAVTEALDEAERELEERLGDIPGAQVERKKYSVTSHYRRVSPDRAGEVIDVVAEVASLHPEVRATKARKAAELVPDLTWDKGHALRWLLRQLAPPEVRLTPVYAGDDLTDEDALEAIYDVGLGIVVRSSEHGDRETAARVGVDDPDQLVAALGRIADLVQSREVAS